MHELSLYGSIPVGNHDHLLQQLAGLTAMQPQAVHEIHVVFKGRQALGLEKVSGTVGGGSAGTQQQQQDLQRLRTMLQSGVFYVQLIGSLLPRDNKRSTVTRQGSGENSIGWENQEVEWTFEFKDTPEAAKQSASTRLVSRVKFNQGDMVTFLDMFGFEYVNRYVVEGQRFYHQDTSLFLHRVRRLPAPRDNVSATDISDLPPWAKLPLFDASGTYILQAMVEIVDGNTQELRDRATGQLLALRDTLKSEVTLAQPDRLALDTRVPITRRP
ncbi:hypothetical protein LTR64_007059 [Lithohypha guttulata]|uniref:uncharacterized protein n=1 Tax=Lithohypha guttulata TaxID=1690604 RepID=UPI002DE17E49|nr:Mediator of RNA polymerase II transcription subunit 18 [Lithohypha guttulata]